MEWVLLGVVALAVIALGVSRSGRDNADQPAPESTQSGKPAAKPSPTAKPDPSLAATDQAEIDHLFAAVDAEIADKLIELLEVRLRDVIRRQVPVRSIRSSPAPSVARICFSNGVIVLAKTRASGGLIPMAKAMLSTSVTLERYDRSDEEKPPALHFVWRNGGHVEVTAVGLDQAD
ncbi:hypothetical protein K0651_06205 [Ornithinimicrobium sp. Arc0846-15]|nr:hypothetical protein [Ornithinimicrobium laminariae]